MPISSDIEQAIARYDAYDEHSLQETLGILATANSAKPELIVSPTATVTADSVAEMGLLEDFQDLGGRLLKRWSRELHRVVCGTDPADDADRKEILASVNSASFTAVGAATAITTVLVGTFALNAAIAPVIAIFVAKVIIAPAQDSVCEFWGEKLKEM